MTDKKAANNGYQPKSKPTDLRKGYQPLKPDSAPDAGYQPTGAGNNPTNPTPPGAE